MNSFLSRSLTCLVLTGVSSQAFAQSKQELSLYLDQSFETLGAEAHHERMVNGGVTIGMGAVITGLGIWGLTSKGSEAHFAGGLATGLGIAYGAWGVYELMTPRSIEEANDEFHKLPASTPEQLQQKITWGESRLELAASDARRQRIRGGWTMIILGAGLATLELTDTTRSAESKRVPAVIFGGVFPIMGIASLLSESREEEFYHRYLDKKNGLPVRSAYLPSGLHLDLAPTLNGGVVMTASLPVGWGNN